MATVKQETASVTKPSSPEMQTPRPPAIIFPPPPIDANVRTNVAKLELSRPLDHSLFDSADTNALIQMHRAGRMIRWTETFR